MIPRVLPWVLALASVLPLRSAPVLAATAPVIHNGNRGVQADAVLEPELMWAVDTEQAEVLIGRVADVEIGPDGNVYLLDNQLSQIYVYSPEGEYLRTLGHEGEGPGEFRNPMDMFFLGHDALGVVQLMPGKVAMLDLDGNPTGDLSVPRSSDDTPQMLMAGRSAGDHVVMQLSSHALQDATVRITTSLVGVALDGSVLAKYFEHVDEQKIHASGGAVAISFNGETLGTWAAAEDGILYHAPGRNEYSIRVLDPRGELLRVIEREYVPRERPEREIQARREAVERFGGPAPEIDPTDPDIAELLPRPGGTLWVLTSRGESDRPEGSVGVYDVFDGQGRFQNRLTIQTGFDAGDDVAFFTADRLFVIENGAGALTAGGGGMQIVMTRGDENDEEEGAIEPMRILCYRLQG